MVRGLYSEEKETILYINIEAFSEETKEKDYDNRRVVFERSRHTYAEVSRVVLLEFGGCGLSIGPGSGLAAKVRLVGKQPEFVHLGMKGGCVRITHIP